MIFNGTGMGVGGREGLKTKLQTGGIQMVRFEASNVGAGFSSLKKHRWRLLWQRGILFGNCVFANWG